MSDESNALRDAFEKFAHSQGSPHWDTRTLLEEGCSAYASAKTQGAWVVWRHLSAQIESLKRERDEARRICGRFGVVEWGLMAPPVPNEVETRRAELDAAKETLSAIRQYGNDTLSGPLSPIPRDMEWYRLGVIEMRNRARDGWNMPKDTARARTESKEPTP